LVTIAGLSEYLAERSKSHTVKKVGVATASSEPNSVGSSNSDASNPDYATVFCLECGGTIPAVSKFCRNCGARQIGA
jgi:hypothetical protein